MTTALDEAMSEILKSMIVFDAHPLMYELRDEV